MYKVVFWETLNHTIHEIRIILAYKNLVGVEHWNFMRLFNQENILKQIILVRIPDKVIYFQPDIGKNYLKKEKKNAHLCKGTAALKS